MLRQTSILAGAVLALVVSNSTFALDGKGDHQHHAVHHPITTTSHRAQDLFDLGLGQAFGFNHDQAAATFRRATQADPGCAMCWWGVAFALGPNINFPMEESNQAEAWAATQRALTLAKGVTDRERAYIEAIAERYSPTWTADRKELDHAYAKAMRRLAYRFADDLEARTLFAEALMDTTPWDYWLADGSPKPVTTELIDVLQDVLLLQPDHPGAAHFLIHAVEKARPELGVPAADALASIPQLTGHLRHMASHIYIRVGRYHDASRVNQEAIAADKELFAGDHAQGVYKAFLAPHNVHFLWTAATLEGRSELALRTADELAAYVDTTAMRAPGVELLQHFWITPLYAKVRFGKWEQVLAYPEPADDLLYPKAIWHYARGLAFVRTSSLQRAEAELGALNTVAADPRLKELTLFGLNTMGSLVRIARGVLAGEVEAAHGRFDSAVAQLEQAVAIEDGLTYDEPPPWHQPVRQVLGQVELLAGRPVAAAETYREDLERFPHNGWSLFGLTVALDAQGLAAEADDARRRFAQAWENADVELAASRY